MSADKDTAFVRIPVSAIPVVVAALQSAGLTDAANNVTSFARQYLGDSPEEALRLKSLALADDTRARDGDIEFDPDAAVSACDEGAYVMGWVWVENESRE